MSGVTADALIRFGISGDLARKKLFGALNDLTAQGDLDPLSEGESTEPVWRSPSAAPIEWERVDICQVGDGLDLERKRRYRSGIGSGTKRILPPW